MLLSKAIWKAFCGAKTKTDLKVCRYIITAENLKLVKQRRNSEIHANSISHLKPIYCAHKLRLFLKRVKGEDKRIQGRKIRSDYLLCNSHTFPFVLRRVFKIEINFQAMSFDCKKSAMLPDNWAIRPWAVEESKSGGTSEDNITDPSKTTPCKGHVELPLIFFLH